MSENSIKVLLIEDNPGDARLIRELFEDEPAARIELAHASDLESGLDHLALGRASILR